MRIRWLHSGVRSRDAQLTYIARRNPAAAARLGEAVRAAVRLLAEHPEVGRQGRVSGTRELVVSRTPYVVACRIVREDVVIVRVLHSAQRWPPMH